MALEQLLEKLDQVRQVGVGEFVACCPAHDDRNPSLAISVKEDNCVLIWCHAGCGACNVLDAIGLDFSALYPQPFKGDSLAEKPLKRRFSAHHILQAVSHELLVAIQICTMVLARQPLAVEDHARLVLVTARIFASLEQCNG